MAPRKGFWDCHGKGPKGQPCGYMVPTGKIACDACGHQPPLHISCPGKTCAGKGASKADAAGGRKSSGNGNGKSSGSDDAAKLKAALSARAAADAKVKEGAKAHAALLAELKKLKAAGNSPPRHGPSIEADAMEQDAGDLETSALDEAVVQARDELKQMQGFTTFHRSLITDFGAKLASTQGKLDDALVARRAANPLKKQLETAEAHQKRSGKKLEDAKASLETKRKELADAQLAIERQQAAVVEAEAVVAKVDAEVAVLAARFASERNAPLPTAAGSAVQLQVPTEPAEGFVTVAFAEEKWAEREAAFAQQIAQLQALVVPVTDAQSEASPSEAGDLDLADPLDDGAWSKVEPAKRHKLLHRQRDALARNVRSKLSKVSAASSPFVKA
jgi:predicted  nucleic acid-binding Zn-ribbon protein